MIYSPSEIAYINKGKIVYIRVESEGRVPEVELYLAPCGFLDKLFKTKRSRSTKDLYSVLGEPNLMTYSEWSTIYTVRSKTTYINPIDKQIYRKPTLHITFDNKSEIVIYFENMKLLQDYLEKFKSDIPEKPYICNENFIKK